MISELETSTANRPTPACQAHRQRPLGAVRYVASLTSDLLGSPIYLLTSERVDLTRLLSDENAARLFLFPRHRSCSENPIWESFYMLAFTSGACLVISPEVTVPRGTPGGFHYKRSKASWVNAADRCCANTYDTHGAHILPANRQPGCFSPPLRGLSPSRAE